MRAADFDASFWRGHIRLGVASTALCSLVGVVYALSTWGGPHRVAVTAIGALALVTLPFVLSRRAMAVFTGPRREPLLYAWSASLLLAVGTSVMLDGGARSPLTWLLTASLVFTASGFDRRGALRMSVATVTCYLTTFASGRPPLWDAVFMVNALLVIAATSTLTAGRLRRLLEVQAELTEQLRWQAAHDGLTGCLTHASFLERVDAAVARAHRTRRPLGMLMLDLDDFKRANDTFGHVVADELLAALGTALRESVRDGDVVGRVGGDEFAVVVTDADENETAQLALRLKRRLTDVGAGMGVGVSIGSAALHSGDDGRELRMRADRALYVSKRREPRTITLT